MAISGLFFFYFRLFNTIQLEKLLVHFKLSSAGILDNDNLVFSIFQSPLDQASQPKNYNTYKLLDLNVPFSGFHWDYKMAFLRLKKIKF